MYYFPDIHTNGVEAHAQPRTVNIITLFRSIFVTNLGTRCIRKIQNTTGYAIIVIKNSGWEHLYLSSACPVTPGK